MRTNMVAFPDCDVEIIDLTNETPPSSPSDSEETNAGETDTERARMAALLAKSGRMSLVRVS